MLRLDPLCGVRAIRSRKRRWLKSATSELQAPADCPSFLSKQEIRIPSLLSEKKTPHKNTNKQPLPPGAAFSHVSWSLRHHHSMLPLATPPPRGNDYLVMNLNFVRQKRSFLGLLKKPKKNSFRNTQNVNSRFKCSSSFLFDLGTLRKHMRTKERVSRKSKTLFLMARTAAKRAEEYKRKEKQTVVLKT